MNVELLPSRATYVVEFDGQITRRAFWLYVFVASPSEGPERLYVGMTGDSSSFNAQSPDRRLGQHLDAATYVTTNQLRKRLEAVGVEIESSTFRFVTHGPILAEPEVKSAEVHYPLRDALRAMERRLAEDLDQAGYEVLSISSALVPLDEQLYTPVRKAFAEHFPKLVA